MTEDENVKAGLKKYRKMQEGCCGCAVCFFLCVRAQGIKYELVWRHSEWERATVGEGRTESKIKKSGRNAKEARVLPTINLPPSFSHCSAFPHQSHELNTADMNASKLEKVGILLNHVANSPDMTASFFSSSLMTTEPNPTFS